MRDLDVPTTAPAPLVTILLLTFNHENFIAEAIGGVLAQTYAPLEILILDDASTDATPQRIAAELARHPPQANLRVIRNDANLGFRDNTIRGLADAQGEFVIRLGGDDIVAPNLVERLVEVWQAENVSLITVNASYIDATSKSLDRLYRDPAALHDESFETLARDGVNVVCFGPVIACERALYAEFGWPPAYLQASDIIMPFYAYLAKGARFLPEVLVQYRFHASNLSISLAAERFSDPVDKLLAEERMAYLHLAHAQFMDDELLRLSGSNSERFGGIAERIRPLLTVQKNEKARKLVEARIRLHHLGIDQLAAPPAPSRAR